MTTIFHVPDMTCGHCVRAITQAIHAVDAGATVDVDLATHRVRVDAASVGVPALREAIVTAGYAAQPAADAASGDAAAAADADRA